jgi:hypothetical protein
MFCTHCGKEITDLNTFCTDCGSPAQDVSAASSQAQIVQKTRSSQSNPPSGAQRAIHKPGARSARAILICVGVAALVLVCLLVGASFYVASGPNVASGGNLASGASIASGPQTSTVVGQDAAFGERQLIPWPLQVRKPGIPALSEAR